MDRKGREQKESDASMLNQAMIESMPYGVNIVDEKGRVLFINRAMTAAVGEDAIGRVCWDNYRDERTQCPTCPLHQPIEIGKTIKTRSEGVFGGKVFEITHTGILHAGKKALLEIFVDITDREKAEKNFRDRTLQYEALFRSSNDGIIIADFETKKFLFANPAACRKFGYDESEFSKLGVIDIHPADSIAATVAEFEAQAKGEKQVAYDIPCKTKDGAIFYADISTALFPIGDRQCLAGIFHDVSAKKESMAEIERLREQFRQSQKLESVGRLAGGIAHDFNNLLTAILGSADFLSEDLASDDPKREDLDQIMNAAKRAAQLTSQLLAFSRKQILQPKVLSLNAVIEDIESLLRRTLSEQVTIVSELAPSLSRVKADESQLGQVLLNLAVNADDAMRNGGTLLIKTANVEVSDLLRQGNFAVPAGSYITLSVSDTGIGMSPENIEKIFDPFFTTKEVGKGTGLGLSTVYGIVKQSGGFILVDSTVGRGSTFVVYLPVTQEPDPETSETQTISVRASGNGTVLLAEDDALVRRTSIRILKKCGYEVLEASGGEEVLKILEQNETRVDLLITDIVMPGMDGAELAKRARQLCPEIKILFTSGYPGEAIAHRGDFIPGTNFIPKPFTPLALAELVRKVLVSPRGSVNRD